MMLSSFIKKTEQLPRIADYKLTEPWRNTNSGNARWSFAKKDGKEFFIKEFISPSCPTSKALSPETIAAKKAICYEFYKMKRDLYDRIEKSANGNIVTIGEFFLFGTKYYITTDKISITKAEIETIAKASDDKKLLLLKIISNSLKRLHENGVVHADLKPSNILIKESDTGNFVAKIIDFDSSYIVGQQPDFEEIQGDLPYLAPETCRYMFGEKIELTQKVDVFAAGLLFHLYFTGELPTFSADYESAHEALLGGGKLDLSPALPSDLADLIGSMLALDPDDRPDMATVFRCLSAPDQRGSQTIAERNTVSDAEAIRQGMKDTEGFWYRPTGFSAQ